MSYSGLEIAVIGWAGRFPNAASVDELWQKLLAGEECISFFEDAQLRASGVDPGTLDDPNYVKAAGVLDGVDLFDAAFFCYSPRDAALLDPQQRLFLEVAWSALEHAGYPPNATRGQVGVYAGAGPSDYLLKHVLRARGADAAPAHHELIANEKDFLTTRVSYKLNLQGPSLAIQTACSTSLVAIHHACQSLIAGECDMALAGGVTIRTPQRAGYIYQEEGILSPDGHCRAFAADAHGTVPGNGAAVVVLKRLADALADRDCIHAVVKGSAVNNDGARKVGYTAPRIDGQAAAIRSALRVAGTPADTVGYLEAHGTGTLVGDPIEIQAATQAFRDDTDATGYCAIGSVKTNAGHLDAAAGVTGFIKAALAVEHGVIPPSLHYGRPNPAIPFESSPFFVNTTRREWTQPGRPRRAGVSSFGIGGTNAHVILEEPPALQAATAVTTPELLVLSAKSESALDRACADLAAHLEGHRETHLADVGFTLRAGRAAFTHRRALVCSTLEEAIAGLRAPASRRQVLTANAPEAARVIFMFPGQGAQHVGMGAGLYASQPEFRRHIDAAADLLRSRLDLDLRDIVCGSGADDAITERLRHTRVAQPAMFAVSYAMAAMVTTWGLRPWAIIGHSIGEYVAACLAGVLSFEDALSLVAERGRLMESVEPGSMLSVALDTGELQPLLPPDVALAAVNGPGRCVVAGSVAAVQAFHETLRVRGIDARPLHTSHAFHSPMMDPVLGEFAVAVQKVTLRSPAIPYASNVSGSWITASETTDPEYWVRHLRGTVQFSAGLQTILRSRGGAVLLELGPGQTLTSLARRHAAVSDAAFVVSAAMRRPDDGHSDDAVLRQALGDIWTAGVDLDWERIDDGTSARRVPLPTYPFQRERHWIDPVPAPGERAKREDVADWFAAPSWQRLTGVPLPAPSASDPRWLRVVFCEASGFGRELARQLTARGDEVATVTIGGEFVPLGDRSFQINPEEVESYHALCRALGVLGHAAVCVVHCWTVEPDADARSGFRHLDSCLTNGFDSLLFLAQALGEQPWVRACRIAAVSTNVYDVVGGETLRPEKATLAGPCRVIPIEYPGYECMHIDVQIAGTSGADERVVRRTIYTIDRFDAGIVAIRGDHRWQRLFVPLRLEPPAALPLKDRGVYLITGGHGGVGLAMAQQLVKTVGARLILVGRTPLPPRGEWSGWLLDDSRRWSAAMSRLQSVETNIAARLQRPSIAEQEELDGALNRLCTIYALRFLEHFGVDRHGHERFTRDELASRCQVLPAFRRLFTRMLEILREDGFVELDGSSGWFTDRAPAETAEQLRDRTIAAYPEIAPLVVHLDACGSQLPLALTGGIPALDLLFGDAYAEMFLRAGETVLRHSYMPFCHELVHELLPDLLKADGTTRILEVGGGEGRLTDGLVPLLAQRDVTYHFTDIGRSFVVNARRKAERQGLPFMRFGTLDISRPPVEQGFTPGSFDIVLAFNVAHATRDVAETLAHARDLLAPGGTLILVETVRASRWADFTWGLTEGWWAFQDTARRSSSPLMSRDAWIAALRDVGFESADLFPHVEALRVRPDAALIVAQKARGITAVSTLPTTATSLIRDRISRLHALESSGAEIEVVCADVTDRQQMEAAIARALRRFGTINGVIHAALVLNDRTIPLKTREDVAAVFAPKIAGTLVLRDVTAGLPLDFFAMFSSAGSVLGGPGQIDYCAASNFQDAFAHAESKVPGPPVVSVDWGAWRETGQVWAAAVQAGESPDRAVPDGMSNAEGFDALMRVLASGSLQTVVSPVELPLNAAVADRRRIVRSAASAPAPAAVSVEPAGMRSESAPSRPVEGAPRTDTERVISEIWRDLLGVETVRVDDNFFDLGGDSLVSLQFIAKARRAGLRFTNKQVFEHQTVAALAAAASEAAGAASSG